jgi:hypothetical protein
LSTLLLACQPQTLNIVDLAIHGVVGQKPDSYGNSDIQNSQKLDPLEITAKKYMPKYASLSKIFWCKKLTHGALQKVEYNILMLFGLVDSAHASYLRGQLYVVKVIYQSSDFILSKQMTDPPSPLPLELPYL